MAQQIITGGDGITGQTGEEVKDIINENFTELYNRYRGDWVWASNGNAFPTWLPGSIGFSVGDHGAPGDADYVPDGALMIKRGATHLYADFKFI